MGTSLCVCFREATAVYLPAYLRFLSFPGREGHHGAYIRLLDSGIKKREGKAAVSLVPGENALQRHGSSACSADGRGRPEVSQAGTEKHWGGPVSQGLPGELKPWEHWASFSFTCSLGP